MQVIKVFIETSPGRRVQANQLDWKWMNAAGWDDVYTGQRAKGWDKSGKPIHGIAYPEPPRPLSQRPSDYSIKR